MYVVVKTCAVDTAQKSSSLHISMCFKLNLYRATQMSSHTVIESLTLGSFSFD